MGGLGYNERIMCGKTIPPPENKVHSPSWHKVSKTSGEIMHISRNIIQRYYIQFIRLLR
jgi:hypothetical protein